MAKQVFTNNARATLQSAITAASTSIVLATGKGALFASPSGGDWQLATLTDGTTYEIVKITARSTDTLTVTRGQEGTSATGWAANALIYAGVTKGTLDRIPQNAATGTNAIAIGTSAAASYTAATAVGNGANASNVQATAIGDNASAAAYAASLGSNAQASAQGGVAVGYLAIASYQSAVAAGDSCSAADIQSVAIGPSAHTGYANAWQSAHAYSVGDTVNGSTNDNLFVCAVAGTSGGTEPTWNESGGITTDSGVTWRDLGADSLSGWALASGYQSLAFSEGVSSGRRAVASVRGVSVGRESVAASYSVSIGGNAVSYSYDSVAVGYHAECSHPTTDSYCNVALGDYAVVTSYLYGMALGSGSINRIDNSWTTTGAPLIRKDNGEDAAKEHLNYAGAEAVYFSKEIDLKSLTDDIATITIPTGATFFPNEIGLVITSAASVTGNPDVSFGVTGNTTSLLASTTVTAVAAKNRTVFTPLSKHGVNSLTASVKTAATGTTLLGRFYWIGLLVEDE